MNQFERSLWQAGDFQRQANERALSESVNQYNDAIIKQQDQQRINDIKTNVSGIIANLGGFLS